MGKELLVILAAVSAGVFIIAAVAVLVFSH
jgi:hypothetical protein